MHKGNVPSPDQYPITLGTLQLPDERWTVSLLQARIGTPGQRLKDGPAPASDDWWNIKLWADGRALHKANYWTSWSPTERRLTARGDTKALAAREPLIKTLLAALQLMTLEFTGSATSIPFVRAQCDCQGTITVGIDPMYEELCVSTMMRARGMAAAPPRVFTDAERPALMAMARMVNAERMPSQGWSTVRDELTGGFTLVAK
jgi:hypothetical protein